MFKGSFLKETSYGLLFSLFLLCFVQALSQLQDGEVQAPEAAGSSARKETEIGSENENLRTRLAQVRRLCQVM